MGNRRRLLGVRRMDRVPNAQIRVLCGVVKGFDEKIDEIVFCWFGDIERMETDRIAKRVYVGECLGSRLVGRPRKRCIDSVNDCLKKRDLNIGQSMIGMNGGSL